jgi:hypothetical protein
MRVHIPIGIFGVELPKITTELNGNRRLQAHATRVRVNGSFATVKKEGENLLPRHGAWCDKTLALSRSSLPGVRQRHQVDATAARGISLVPPIDANEWKLCGLLP